MLRKALTCAVQQGQLVQRWRMIASSATSNTVNSIILRSLKDHYLEVTKMTPPPKISPPNPYTVVKRALDGGGPVLKGTFRDEEISISVMRLVDIIPGGSGDDNGEDSINQLFVHVDISKPGQQESLHFLCGLYPDALGIHSVSLRPKAESSGFLGVPTKYNGPVFEEQLEGEVDQPVQAQPPAAENPGVEPPTFPQVEEKFKEFLGTFSKRKPKSNFLSHTAEELGLEQPYSRRTQAGTGHAREASTNLAMYARAFPWAKKTQFGPMRPPN